MTNLSAESVITPKLQTLIVTTDALAANNVSAKSINTTPGETKEGTIKIEGNRISVYNVDEKAEVLSISGSSGDLDLANQATINASFYPSKTYESNMEFSDSMTSHEPIRIPRCSYTLTEKHTSKPQFSFTVNNLNLGYNQTTDISVQYAVYTYVVFSATTLTDTAVRSINTKVINNSWYSTYSYTGSFHQTNNSYNTMTSCTVTATNDDAAWNIRDEQMILY